MRRRGIGALRFVNAKRQLRMVGPLPDCLTTQLRLRSCQEVYEEHIDAVSGTTDKPELHVLSIKKRLKRLEGREVGAGVVTDATSTSRRCSTDLIGGRHKDATFLLTGAPLVISLGRTSVQRVDGNHWLPATQKGCSRESELLVKDRDPAAPSPARTRADGRRGNGGGLPGRLRR